MRENDLPRRLPAVPFFPGEYQLDFWRKHWANNFVYVIGRQFSPVVKIGKAQNPRSRMKTFQTANFEQLYLMFVVPGYGELEKELHRIAQDDWVSGEHFSTGPAAAEAVAEVQRLATETVASVNLESDDLFPFVKGAGEHFEPQPHDPEIWREISEAWHDSIGTQRDLRAIRLRTGLLEDDFQLQLLRMHCEGNYRFLPTVKHRPARLAAAKTKRAKPKSSREYKHHRLGKDAA